MSTIVGDNDHFRHRLAKIVTQFGSVAALSRALGISDNAIYKWLSGRGEPNIANLVRLAKAGGVSIEWLAIGGQGELPSTSPVRANPADYAFVPKHVVEGPAAQGFPITSEQFVDYLAFKIEWVRSRLRVDPANLVLIEAIGDAMFPTFTDSDLLIVDLAEPGFRHDGIYVLRNDNDLAVRRIQSRPDGKLTVGSDNPAYEPYVVRSDRLRIIGRVIWGGRRL